MVNLTMYNMGHGDCFLIADQTEGVLIDCGGSAYSSAIVKTYVSPDLLSIQNKRLVITHFHNDHINKIKLLNKNIKFKDVYVPNALNTKDIHRAFAIIKYGKPRSKAYAMAYNYLMLIPMIEDYLDKSSTIHYVSRFYKMDFNFSLFEVLWPDKNLFFKEDLNFKFTKKEKEIISEYESIFLEYIQDEYSSITVTLERYKKNRDIKSIMDDFKQQPKDVEKDYTFNIKEISKKLGNQLSLVIIDSNKSLFTGDITKKIFNEEVASHVVARITILKTPHHGSKSYFTYLLPNADIAFVTEISSKGTIDYANYCLSGNYSRIIMCDPDLRNPNIVYLSSFIKIPY